MGDGCQMGLKVDTRLRIILVTNNDDYSLVSLWAFLSQASFVFDLIFSQAMEILLRLAMPHFHTLTAATIAILFVHMEYGHCPS